MPIAAPSVSKSLLGTAFSATSGGDWFARFTAALKLGAAVGGVALGSLDAGSGKLAGRVEAAGVRRDVGGAERGDTSAVATGAPVADHAGFVTLDFSAFGGARGTGNCCVDSVAGIAGVAGFTGHFEKEAGAVDGSVPAGIVASDFGGDCNQRDSNGGRVGGK